MLAVLMLNRMTMKRRSLLAKEAACKLERKPDIQSLYCRTCLAADNLVAIFYNPGMEKKRTDELRLVTGLEIKQNDGLSQKMCKGCIEKLNNALQFRRTSKKAEKSLLNMSVGLKLKKKSISKVTRKTVKIKSPKVQKIKQKVEKVEELEYECSFDDFQNDYDDDKEVPLLDYSEEVEEKPKVKQLQQKKPPARRRATIPNAASYKCGTCSKEFRMKATYKAHMRFHTNYCVCEACGKRCRNNNQLQEHKRARHGLGRIHKCAYCEYSSATKEALTIHERRHTGERPYICDHCGASFHRRSNLVQHIAIHLPDKNFQVHDVTFAPDTSIILKETLPALDRAVKDGKARYIGIADYDLQLMKEIIEESDIKISTILSYSKSTLFDNRLQNYTKYFKSKGLGVINAAATGMGLLTNGGPQPWHPASDDIKAICKQASDYCKEQGVELARLATWFTLNQPDVDTNVCGFFNIEQMLDTLSVLDKGLSEHEKSVLAYLQFRFFDSVTLHWDEVELSDYKAKLDRLST